jgi:hypothetical protein
MRKLMSAQDYETKKKKAIEMIPAEYLELIKRNYPKKGVRDAKIRALAQMGIKHNILADLSGIGRSRIWRIVNFGK